MSKLLVQSIFHGIDGESNGYCGAGQMSIFIRLCGCNLRCQYCDTTYAQTYTTRQGSPQLGAMTPEEIMSRVRMHPNHRKITLTGGEPLLQLPQLTELIGHLIDAHFDITVETNGSIPIRRSGLHHLPRIPVLPNHGVVGHGSIRFVVDYKLPSSGMEEHMDGTLWHDLSSHDVIKFVICDDVDYHRALAVINDHLYLKSQVVFSPGINLDLENPMAWATELATRMIQDSRFYRCNIHFSLQIHKVLWPGATVER